MKTIIVLLMSVLIMGCAGIKREIHYIREKQKAEKVVEVVTPEDKLMRYPCKAVPPGDALIELAINYDKNVSCIKLYQNQLEKIRKDIKNKEKTYEHRSK